MKHISIKEVKEVLFELIHETIERREASIWASKLMQAEDEKGLIYEPKELEELIWDSIVFINGIDLESSSGVYLHPIEQIKDLEKKLP